ncbi:LysR family transcriptional regulator [Ancylobacter sonchi]|uniref:LysR substrate-binding domain-containing protein n=1 Tax=Ancylobacter sonchi TaxID=1937790 RepID=UPI001BD2E129|nr:LysR substrate-binding domain-containing protein [Ancylobacter sonchi]MBS7534092.1 LysR family transcriptional regulator [Ancylobacter sonchi]
MQLPIRAIFVFRTVARLGSISKAAEELAVTPSAVSQQVQALETQLGLTLMSKVGRRVVLTEAGERYFASINDEVERIAEATNLIRGYRSVTTLTVRATPTLSNKWLLPRLGAFLDRHPDLEVRIDGTNEPTTFRREVVDVEIRHGDGRWPGLFVEGMAEEDFLPACSPDYAPAASLTAAELPRFRLIHSVKSQAQWPRWFALAGVQPTERWARVLFDRSHMAIDAAAGAMGIALESTLMMERELETGRLICPVAEPPPIRLVTQWIVCPHEHLRQRKVRLFLDWLRAERAGWEARRRNARAASEALARRAARKPAPAG